VALGWNDLLFAARRAMGLPYWSLSAWLKHKVRNAVEYVSRFEEAVAAEAARRGVDGVVCGHIHHAEIRKIGDILYLNDGDRVESCSALVEDARGKLEILRWAPNPTRAVPAPTFVGEAQAAFIPAWNHTPQAGADPRRGGAVENPDRHRCLASPGQWRGPHHGGAGPGPDGAGP